MDLHSIAESLKLIDKFKIGLGDDRASSSRKADESNCATTSTDLGKHQKVARAIVETLCTPGNRNRGVLLWHSTGSGKTCTATALMDSVWNTPRRIIYLSSVEGIAANPESNFHNCALRFLTERHPNATIDQIQEAFERKGVEFLSFAQLAHILQLHRPRKAASPAEKLELERKLRHTLLIVDEVHALLSPFPGQRAECEKLIEFLTTDETSKTTDLKVVMLTATPGNTVEEVLRVLNIVRDPGTPMLSYDEDSAKDDTFAKNIRGLVSFFDYSGDKTRYPTVDEKVHRAPMAFEQAFAISTLAGKQPAESELDKLTKSGAPERFWQLARRYANTLFDWPRDLPMSSFSAKLAMLVRIIKDNPDAKHLVYSAFSDRRGYGGHGARAIVRALTEHGGFTDFDRDVELRKPKERVALVASGQDVSDIVNTFNDKGNARGAMLRVLVATQGYNEGLDLKGVRHIHVFEPLISMEDRRQLIGRGVRMCSHADLRYPSEWTVTVHSYIADPPTVANAQAKAAVDLDRLTTFVKESSSELDTIKGIRGQLSVKSRRDKLKSVLSEAKQAIQQVKVDLKNLKVVSKTPSVDSEVYALALKRSKDLDVVLQILRDNAIDCEIFKEFHARAGIKVQCMGHAESRKELRPASNAPTMGGTKTAQKKTIESLQGRKQMLIPIGRK